MSDVIIEQFIEKLTGFYGRAFTIVSGRDSYSFEKHTHKSMIDHEGVYLLLENVPLNHMIRKYDKATLVPAVTVNRMLPTNDPNIVKKGYTLSGSKLRMEFYKQSSKLYQAHPVFIREVIFTQPRKAFRLERKDWSWLTKYGGDILFLCSIECISSKRLIDIIKISARDIIFENGQNSKTIILDLDGIVLKRIQDLGYSVTAQYGVLTNGQYNDIIAGVISEEKLEYQNNLRKDIKSTEPIQQILTNADMNAAKLIDEHLRNTMKQPESSPKKLISIGQMIKVTIPGEDHDFEVDCMITDFRTIEKRKQS